MSPESVNAANEASLDAFSSETSVFSEERAGRHGRELALRRGAADLRTSNNLCQQLASHTRGAVWCQHLKIFCIN